LFMLNPVGMYMNRRLHDWDLRGQVRNNLNYFWRYLVAVSIFSVLVLIFLTSLNIWNPSINLYWLLLLVCCNLIFGTLNQIVIPGLNLLGYRCWFTVLTVATTAASLIIALVLVRTIYANAEYWLCGLLMGQVIFGLIGKIIFFSKLKQSEFAGNAFSKLSRLQIHGLLRFAWPIAIAVGLGWIQSQSYRYLVEQRLGLNDLGLFVAGFGISAGLIAGFESIFATYFQPKFYKRVSTENISEQTYAWHEYVQAMLPSMLLTAAFIMIVAPELTKLLLGSAYRESSQFVVWGAIAEFSRVATAVFALASHARMKTKKLIIPNAVGAMLSLSLVWILIPIYGANGVGLGLVCSAFATLLLTVYITSNFIVLNLPRKPLVKAVVMGLVLLVGAVILRRTLNSALSLLPSLVTLAVVGAFFLSFQYQMIRPVLEREKNSIADSHNN